MDRATVYTQEQGRSVDFLFAQRATMIGLAKLSQAAFGSGTMVRGLAVSPNSPAALNVLVGIGEIYAMEQVDATTWGALPADTTDIILKQGLNMAAQTISTPAPGTSGYSVNYLIEAQYQDQDNVPVVLPFYDSTNPQIPLNGQGGGGATLPTERQGVCVIQAKAGIAATTGTQTTPAVDTGWTALAVVTVANGQSTVTSGNISAPAGVPQLTSLLQMMQTGSTGYAVDTSTTANVIALALTPAVTAYTDGQEITFKAANSNNGPCTINFGAGPVNLVGAAGALQGGEIVATNQYTGIYSASLSEVVLNSQTAGALQVNPATKSQQAVQLGQLGAIRAQAGASYTYAATDAHVTVRRSNSGSAMTDTLPGTSPGVMPATWQVTIINSDTSASDTVSAGAGAQIDGASSVVIGPLQSLTIHSDGSNYYSERGIQRWTTELLLTTVGAGKWTVPPGVTVIEVELWGAGGATSGSSTSSPINGAGAGAYVKNLLAVTPGASISYNVGGGGSPSAYGTTGGNGGTTTFNGGALSAGGGTGSSYTSVGAGGTASGGDLNISGGPGSAVAQGASFPGGQGGAAPRGGLGGLTGGGASAAGGLPGGGAGGPGSGGAYSGQSGANGLILIRY